MNTLNALRFACIALAAVPAVSAHAHAPSDEPQTLAVIEGYASSDAALAGDFDRAIALAENSLAGGVSSYERAAQTSVVCVSMIKTARVSEAAPVCEKALRQARRAGSSWTGTTVYATRDLVVAARSNLRLLRSLESTSRG